MRALIFNSGYGNRMGEFTKTNHKSMARLSNGETIFGRQLRLLSEAGIDKVVVTTGPHEEQLREVASRFPYLNVEFIPNPIFDQTNYIYSMYLARESLHDDVLMMHGDLVFDRDALPAILSDPRPNLGSVNSDLPQPDKDFKARVRDGVITEVSVSIHDEDCIAFQPLYKLREEALGRWMGQVEEFIESGNDKVYAENALNEISDEVGIQTFSYADHFVNEIDTLEDQELHSEALRLWDFRQQWSVDGAGAVSGLPELLEALGARAPMVVGAKSFSASAAKVVLDAAGVDYTVFSDYASNPTLPQVETGMKKFVKDDRDSIVSVGGGSAIDVAKCVKLLVASGANAMPVFDAPLQSSVPHICVPTTAGTGSEATHFSAIYIDGEKHSIAHDAMLPDVVVLDPELLRSLPEYHKKASLLDALTQCVESIWAKGASQESQDYAAQGIRLILEHYQDYLEDKQTFNVGAATGVQLGANYSGKAINLSKTTAAHAMSYGLTSQLGTAHGQAAALCLSAVWDKYNRDPQEQIGTEFTAALERINEAFDVETAEEALSRFNRVIDQLGQRVVTNRSEADIDYLVKMINTERLINSPNLLTEDQLRTCYITILGL